MEEQIDQKYRLRGMIVNIPLWLLTFGVFLVLAYRIWILGNWDLLLIGAFLVLCASGLLFGAWLRKSYKCPKCGKVLGPPTISDHDPSREFVHECPECNIRWRTRTYPPDPSG